jgi:hemerythrin
MDDQHGILMDELNDLRQAVAHGSGQEQVSELLDRLIEFTRMHFASEEQLMEQSAFPGLAEHRAEHQSMLARMIWSAHRLQYGEGVQLGVLLCSLRDGYTRHIEGPDQQYGPWLNDHGLQ